MLLVLDGASNSGFGKGCAFEVEAEEGVGE